MCEEVIGRHYLVDVGRYHFEEVAPDLQLGGQIQRIGLQSGVAQHVGHGQGGPRGWQCFGLQPEGVVQTQHDAGEDMSADEQAQEIVAHEGQHGSVCEMGEEYFPVWLSSLPIPRHLVSNLEASVKNLSTKERHLSHKWMGTSTAPATKQKADSGECRKSVYKPPR